MPTINNVFEGNNKFCGPAVLSILSGKSTDECASAVSSITGNYRVKGVFIQDLIRAGNKLGLAFVMFEPAGSLYGTIVKFINQDGVYLISTETHYVVIEIKDKKVYFCDNHTKEPIPASASARLGAKVITIHKTTVIIKSEYMKTIIDASIINDTVHLFKVQVFQNEKDNIRGSIGTIDIRNVKLDWVIESLRLL